jgi:hypothetical protein
MNKPLVIYIIYSLRIAYINSLVLKEALYFISSPSCEMARQRDMASMDGIGQGRKFEQSRKLSVGRLGHGKTNWTGTMGVARMERVE